MSELTDYLRFTAQLRHERDTADYNKYLAMLQANADGAVIEGTFRRVTEIKTVEYRARKKAKP